MGATDSKEGIPDVEPTAQGVSFEVILSPKVENAKIPQLTPVRSGAITKEAIDKKLQAAELRRKERESEMRQKLLSEDKHIEEVRQAMSEYEERKKRETEARYQRRLFIFAENQEQIASERAEQWEEKAKKIEEAKKTIDSKEKSFREMVKDKLSHKMEKFKENHSRYHFHRHESARKKRERLDAAQSAKQKKIEEHQAVTAKKIKQKHEVQKENREATINSKVTKIQEKQAKIQENKATMKRCLELNSSLKMMELEVRLDHSAIKKQLHEQEVRVKAKAHHERAKELKRLKEERERRFSDCTEENLRAKFEKAEQIRKQNAATRQQAIEKKIEREQKAKVVIDINNGEKEKLREKIEEKCQRMEENRTAILNAKVGQCQKESTKAKITKENAEELARNQEKAANEKLQAKLDAYKENRQKRLVERMEKAKPSPTKNERRSLLEITNGDQMKANSKHNASPRKDAEKLSKVSPKSSTNENAENEENCEKVKELAENFRNRNLQYLGLR